MNLTIEDAIPDDERRPVVSVAFPRTLKLIIAEARPGAVNEAAKDNVDVVARR